jgi:putative transcriptional regulator
MEQRGIAPGLLIAMPQLVDPNFARSVVLMVAHGDDHSFGLVINRPTRIAISDVLAPMGMNWCGPVEARVGWGGPVMPRSGWVLHSGSPLAASAMQLCDGLYLSTSPEELRALSGEPPASLHFLMGYAGWGAGQLEGELAQGSWLTASASAELVFATPSDAAWEASLRSIGVDPSMLFVAPGVH